MIGRTVALLVSLRVYSVGNRKSSDLDTPKSWITLFVNIVLVIKKMGIRFLLYIATPAMDQTYSWKLNNKE